MEVNLRMKTMSKKGRKTRNENDDPGNSYGHQSILFRTNGNGGDGIDDGQESIEWHENQSIDTGIGRDNNQVLNHLTPSDPEGPVGEDVVCSRERDTEYNEEEIRNGQIDNEEIGGIPHLLVRGHDNHDQSISKESNNENNSKEYGNDKGNNSFQLKIMSTVL